MHLGLVGERKRLRPPVRQSANPHQEGVALDCRHRGNEGRRGNTRTEIVGGEALREGERSCLRRPEERRLGERTTPDTELLVGKLSTERREQVFHPALHRIGEIAAVPDQREKAARTKHAMELRQRSLVIEPVE